MSNSPLVSILFPVYNSENFLNESIGSILSQTYKNWELLIIYYESKDKSLDIIKNFLKKDSRILLINNPKKGLINSLNHGIKIANGEFLVRMDSDDISISDRIEKQIKHMKKNKLDICGCHHYIIDKKGSLGNVSYVPLVHEHCFIRLLSAVPFAHPAVVIRKAFLIKNNLKYGMNAKFAEDLDLWINMYNAGALFGNIDKIKLKYRILETSLSRQNAKLLMSESLLLYDSFFEKNLKKISEILNQKIEFKNDIEKYYYSRMVIRYILRKFDLNKIKKLKGIYLKIIIKAFLVEIKNLILHKVIRYNKK